MGEGSRNVAERMTVFGVEPLGNVDHVSLGDPVSPVLLRKIGILLTLRQVNKQCVFPEY